MLSVPCYQINRRFCLFVFSYSHSYSFIPISKWAGTPQITTPSLKRDSHTLARINNKVGKTTQLPTISLKKSMHTLAPSRCCFAVIYLIAACTSPRGFSIIGKCQALFLHRKNFSARTLYAEKFWDASYTLCLINIAQISQLNYSPHCRFYAAAYFEISCFRSSQSSS